MQSYVYVSTSPRSANNSSIRSRHSSLTSAKKHEAAAELPTTQATLKVLQERKSEKQVLDTLETENRQRLALQEAENAACSMTTSLCMRKLHLTQEVFQYIMWHHHNMPHIYNLIWWHKLPQQGNLLLTLIRRIAQYSTSQSNSRVHQYKLSISNRTFCFH